tara:strand:- start:1525 stop:2850 length:1326 start_codon:yes stop_codon:yes gene_type:complete
VTDFQFRVRFEKFQSKTKIINFTSGIHVIYGESGVGKSAFLSSFENANFTHSHNFSIQVKTDDSHFYRIVQNPDHQILGRTVKNEITFSAECNGVEPIELEQILNSGLAILPPTIEPNMNPGFLSGGEKELLNLITALQSDQDILLIDDGLSFLSKENKESAVEWLQVWTQKTGGIVVWMTSEQMDLSFGKTRWLLGLDSIENIEQKKHHDYDSISIPRGDLSLEWRDVSFQYENSRSIYSYISLSLNGCRSIGLLGGNGSGKTTFAGLCFGYLKPQMGQVELSIKGNNNLRIGYADQFPEHLLHLKTPAEFLDQIIQNGIFNTHLDQTFHNRLSRFGIQWDGIKDVRGIELNWAVLRTFVVVLLAHCKFDVLILDEPTFGLGWNQRVILRSFLRECMTKMHFVIVSHDRLFIQSICDQIIDLDDLDILVPQIGTSEKTES